ATRPPPLGGAHRPRLTAPASWLRKYPGGGAPGAQALGRIASQMIEAPARTRKGIMARFTACHPATTLVPEQFISPPEAKEAAVTPPKTTRSLIPWMRPRSSGAWAVERSVVAPMKPKF